MERGHQLAKYLSCCAASQCAETHVCSRKVAKAGAAACKDCGGAGGGSEWAKTFAVTLCEIFDCPTSVRLEALGLVLAAVTVAAPPSSSSSTYLPPGNHSYLENGPPCSEPYYSYPELGAGDRENYASEGEASGLGSSWESVSSYTEMDMEAAESGRNGEFDDDDEAVKKGIWFPHPLSGDGDGDDSDSLEEPEVRPPAIADGHSCSSGFETSGKIYGRSSSEGGVSSIPSKSEFDGGDGMTVLPLETTTAARSSTSMDGGASFRERGVNSGGHENAGVRCFREAVDDLEKNRDEDEGSEFVLLVSREATVKELAARVRGFPQDWLAQAFGLVVRRQVEEAVYDARARAALKRAVKILDGRLSWSQVAVTEQELAALALDHDMRIQDGDKNKEAPVSGRYWKVGLAAAGGGVLLFLSGGVAAPSVTASLSAVGLGAWLGYTSASASAAATTVGSFGAISAVSGAAGAGVAGYKMTRRTAGVQEFHFLPLHSIWPLDSPESMFEGASEPGLPVFICVPGWHEPGHDPRHTWGGVATPGESSDHPRVWRADSSVEKTDVAAEDNGVFGKGVQASVSPPRPIARTTVTRESKDRWQSVQAAVAGGSVVSRWFSNASVATASESREGARSPVPLLPSMSRSTISGVIAPSVRGTVHGMDRETVHGTNEEHVNGIDRGTVHGSGWESINGNINGSVRGTLCNTERPTRVNDDGSDLPPAPPVASVTSSPMASSFIVLGAGGRSGDRDSARSSGHAFHGGFSRHGDGEVVSPGEREEEETEELDGSWEALPSHAWWRDFVRGGEEHVLVWERGPLTELYTAIRDLAWKSASRRAVKQALKRSALAPVVAAAALPLALLEAASGLDDPWGIVRSRALEAGRLLAAVLLSRPVGSRPVTLLGYSMGAKVVFNCLEALAAAPGDRGLGIVENAVMLGTPVGTKRGRWKRARSAVAGRLINGYSSRDWLLALVYRSKSWSVGVAGTSRVEGCGVENVDLSGLVTWHLSYSRILPVVMAMLRLEQ